MTWPTLKLGELCNVQSGGTPRRGIPHYYGGDIPWVKIGDMDSPDGVVLNTEETITKDGLEAINNRLFPFGTLLLAMYGSVGKIAVAGRELSTNQAILGISIKNEAQLAPRYLFRWLASIQSKLLHRARGATLQNISASIVKELNVPLPPVDEQRRIAAILDKADAICRKRVEAVGIAQKMAQSVFAAMFGHPGRNEKKYPRKDIGDLCQRCSSMNPTAGKLADDKFRYIELGSVDGKVGRIVGVSEFIGRDAPSRARQIVRAGDVLVSTVRPNLRGTALLDMSYDGALGSTGFCVLRPGKDLSSSYLYQVTRFPWFSEQLAVKVRGANYPAVTDKDILTVSIPVPPVTLQQRYDSVVSKITKVALKQEACLREAENMFASLQQYFFVGRNAGI